MVVNPQVYINHHGLDLRFGFIARLSWALRRNNINVSTNFFAEEAALKAIEESRVALVILSKRYSDSTMCLEELAKIKDCVEKGKLVAYVIYYKLEPSTVRNLSGMFGDAFRYRMKCGPKKKEIWGLNPMTFGPKKKEIWETTPFKVIKREVEFGNAFNAKKKKKWENALRWIPSIKNSLMLPERKLWWWESEESYENKTFKDNIVPNVKILLGEIPILEGTETSSRNLSYGFVSHLVKALETYKVRRQLGMIMGCLLILFFFLQQIGYMSIGLIYQGGPMDGTLENEQKVLEYIPTEGTKNPIDKYTEFPIGEVGAKHRSSTSNFKTVVDLLESKLKPPQIQVFINFRGQQLRNSFVSYLVDALRRSEINVFIDNHALRGEDLNSLFRRIEDSGIAIVVFSSRYTESKWCLEELLKIKERVDQGMLKVLPIFYKVTTDDVKILNGDFGRHFRETEHTYRYDKAKIKRWKDAIKSVSHKFGETLDEKSNELEIDFVEKIVKKVLQMLLAISTVESSQSSR